MFIKDVDFKSTFFINLRPIIVYKMKKINALLIILSIATIIIISGCTSNNQTTSSQSGKNAPTESNNRFRGGIRNNLTEEERQQMIEARTQLMMKACENKKENDACTMQSQRGEITGVCKNQNEKLVCAAEFNRNQFPNRNNQQSTN